MADDVRVKVRSLVTKGIQGEHDINCFNHHCPCDEGKWYGDMELYASQVCVNEAEALFKELIEDVEHEAVRRYRGIQ